MRFVNILQKGRLPLWIACCFCLAVHSYAQQSAGTRKITGIISDLKGAPLPNTNVSVKNTDKITVTN
ncbi:MAG TPA: hypothetical protein VF008_00335, partial [Niastella sp.]